MKARIAALTLFSMLALGDPLQLEAGVGDRKVPICAAGADATSMAASGDVRDQWWRMMAELKSEDGRRYDVTATFVRFAIFGRDRVSRWSAPAEVAATIAIVDEVNTRNISDMRLDRAALGLAGASTKSLALNVGDWTLRGSALVGLRSDIAHLHVSFKRAQLDLDSSPTKPLIRTRLDAGCDYAFTRLDIKGSIRIDNVRSVVSGEGWLDHQVLIQGLRGVVGWSRFAIQFEDGRELFLSVLRNANGSVSRASSGFLVAKNGSVDRLGLSDFFVDNRARTHEVSSGTSHRYPSLWEIVVPKAALDLEVYPMVQDQEIASPDFSTSVYNGAISVESIPEPERSHGRGFVELTGFDQPVHL